LNAESKFRRFSQTFVLAQQEQGYFIYNDICRFYIYDASEMNVPAKSTIEAKAPVNEIPAIQKASISATVKQPEASVAVQKQSQQLAQERSTVLSGPFNWLNANALLAQKAANSSSASLEKSPSASPKPSTAGKTTEAAHHAGSKGEHSGSYEKRSGKYAGSNYGSAHKKSLYFKKGDDIMNQNSIKEEFSKAGKIIDVQINSSFVAVEYESEKTAEQALSLNYSLNGKQVSVSSKKPIGPGGKSGRSNASESKGFNSHSHARSPSLVPASSGSNSSLLERERENGSHINGSISSIKSSK
jgi:hypothetical protein